jgi:hypothetical protein
MPWRLFRDLGEEGVLFKRSIIASWAEYVRLRSRMTLAASRLQQHIAEVQLVGPSNRVSRLIGLASELGRTRSK